MIDAAAGDDARGAAGPRCAPGPVMSGLKSPVQQLHQRAVAARCATWPVVKQVAEQKA